MANLLRAFSGGAMGAGIVLPLFWLGAWTFGDKLASTILTGTALWTVSGTLLFLGVASALVSKTAE